MYIPFEATQKRPFFGRVDAPKPGDVFRIYFDVAGGSHPAEVGRFYVTEDVFRDGKRIGGCAFTVKPEWISKICITCGTVHRADNCPHCDGDIGDYVICEEEICD